MNKIDEKLRFTSGIYEIFNLENGKRYIGSSKDLYNRLHEHYHNLKFQKAHNKHLQNAWDKYGEECFMYGILEFCDEDIRFEREQYYMDFMHPQYNLSPQVIANKGHSPSEEAKRKISKTLKAKYASGELQTYRQDHAWIKCYIYNIRTFKFEASCDCIADAEKLLPIKNINKLSRHQVYANRYIVTDKKFQDKNELINFISEYYLCCNSKWGKYMIIEKSNEPIKYYRELITCAQENNSSRSTLSKHGDASRENPYLIKNTNCKFYYSNEFIPITGYEAVPIEKSSELLSGNIGESPEMDNTEINSEIKTSESSYSVDSEPLN